MKTEKQIWKRGRHWVLAAAGVLLAGGSVVSSCSEYDLDQKDPEGWGSSVYSWLDEQGNYTNTVRMIDELGYREVLAKTGSKTMFVADDEAYERFFKNNSWGVRRYEDLTESQKKLLIFGSMIDNSIQLNNLSNVEGTPPREGECLRRFAASSIYDSVPVLAPSQMPDNLYWERHRNAGRNMVCMEDMTTVPLVQFIEKLLTNKRITNEDYDFINNHTTSRQVGDASINGVEVSEGNIKCSNGFIHRMKEVVTPLPNMAELIASKSQMSTFNRLLERFCAPYPLDRIIATQYNYLYDTNVDTVFQKRFFSEKSQNGEALIITPIRTAARALLKYDPEWNAYYAGRDEGTGDITMQRDMAVMMVPSDKAMDEYWNNGAGRVLKDYYGTWDKVPDDVIVKLINNNMLASFVASVPSKFVGILNDANDPMGVEESAIDSVWLGCNGAVYMTNRVYSPTAYVSVSFPALINQTMKVIDWGIQKNQYNVYLNSLNTYYSFFIPTNGALLEYIDPVSYGKTQTQLYRFYYDETKTMDERVWASVWNYDTATGTVGDSIGRIVNGRRDGPICTRLKDILETHIVIGNVEDGNRYYRTKGGSEIRVNNVAAGYNGMTVEGSYQVNEGQPIPVSFIYDQTDGGNGKSYILDGQPIMGTRLTVRDQLASHEEFSKFLELMDGSGLFEVLHDKKYACGGINMSLFNTYHYTVYVPTNESIQALQDEGKLPTWEQVEQWEEAGNTAAKTSDSLAIVNFLKYHIQDNALFIGAAKESGDYETAQVNPKTGRFFRLNAELTDDGIIIKDEVDKTAGTSHRVLTTNPALYNLQAREYQYNNTDASKADNLITSSSAVIHLIDRPLMVNN